ncbi:hypothetical protein SAMN05428952_10444 [Nitrosomonas sp. Nm132]|nr:hypothetical protein SAMN05428952_10444 [Nitrosomonas sp. Nm132]
METIAIFCVIDGFCQRFEPWWEQRLLEWALKRRRRRGGGCGLSEIMTIVVGFFICRVTGRSSSIIWARC